MENYQKLEKVGEGTLVYGYAPVQGKKLLCMARVAD